MSALTLFDLEPVIESGIHGTYVVWPSGASVLVIDKRMWAASRAMWTAASVRVDGGRSQSAEAFERDVMAPLRAEFVAAREAALATVLDKGDRSVRLDDALPREHAFEVAGPGDQRDVGRSQLRERDLRVDVLDVADQLTGSCKVVSDAAEGVEPVLRVHAAEVSRTDRQP